MKKSIFAALAVLSLFALPVAHANEVGANVQVASSVSSDDAVTAESAASAIGKLLGTVAAAPKHLVKTVAPSALDAVTTIASDFGAGFKKAFSPDSQSESVSGHEATATSSSGSSSSSSNSVSSSSSAESKEAASRTALPASASQAIAMLRKPPVNQEASSVSN